MRCRSSSGPASVDIIELPPSSFVAREQPVDDRINRAVRTRRQAKQWKEISESATTLFGEADVSRAPGWKVPPIGCKPGGHQLVSRRRVQGRQPILKCRCDRADVVDERPIKVENHEVDRRCHGGRLRRPR
jgi:hypothetical protein